MDEYDNYIWFGYTPSKLTINMSSHLKLSRRLCNIAWDDNLRNQFGIPLNNIMNAYYNDVTQLATLNTISDDVIDDMFINKFIDNIDYCPRITYKMALRMCTSRFNKTIKLMYIPFDLANVLVSINKNNIKYIDYDRDIYNKLLIDTYQVKNNDCSSLDEFIKDKEVDDTDDTYLYIMLCKDPRTYRYIPKLTNDMYKLLSYEYILISDLPDDTPDYVYEHIINNYPSQFIYINWKVNRPKLYIKLCQRVINNDVSMIKYVKGPKYDKEINDAPYIDCPLAYGKLVKQCILSNPLLIEHVTYYTLPITHSLSYLSIICSILEKSPKILRYIKYSNDIFYKYIISMVDNIDVLKYMRIYTLIDNQLTWKISNSVCIHALKKSGNYIKHIDSSSYKLQYLAIRKTPSAIQYIDNPHKYIYHAAVNRDGMLLKYVPIEHQTELICKLAVKQNSKAVMYNGICMPVLNKKNITRKYVNSIPYMHIVSIILHVYNDNNCIDREIYSKIIYYSIHRINLFYAYIVPELLDNCKYTYQHILIKLIKLKYIDFDSIDSKYMNFDILLACLKNDWKVYNKININDYTEDQVYKIICAIAGQHYSIYYHIPDNVITLDIIKKFIKVNPELIAEFNICEDVYNELLLINGYCIYYMMTYTSNMIHNAIKSRPYIIKYLIKKHKYTTSYIISLIKTNNKVLKYIDQSMLIDIDYIDILDNSVISYKYITNPSKQVTLHAMKLNGMLLKHVIAKDEDIINMAIRQCGFAIQYIDNPTEEQCILALIQNKKAVKYIPDYIYLLNLINH